MRRPLMALQVVSEGTLLHLHFTTLFEYLQVRARQLSETAHQSASRLFLFLLIQRGAEVLLYLCSSMMR
jgi:hypothetical protein